MSTQKAPPAPVLDSGTRLAHARRAARLSQVELASRLGTSGWWVDQVEAGTLDPGSRLGAIAAVTGVDEAWLRSPTHAPSKESAASEVLPSLGVIGKWLVLATIATLVTVRFFTEVVPLVPRALNFIDIPIFLALVFASTLSPPRSLSGRTYLHVGVPACALLLLSGASAIVNANRVAPAPLLVFVYGFLAPLALYAAVYRVWPSGSARSLSRVLVALGLVQLVVVAVIDLPRFISSGNPDEIAGTFGTNAYQLVFFLLLVAALLAGIFTLEPSRAIARFAPIFIIAIFIVILLAQYRALLATTVVGLVVVGILLGRQARGVIAGVLIVIAFTLAFSYVAANFPKLKLETTATTLSQSPWSYARERLEAGRPVAGLYRDYPLTIAVGSGPGTFSSRAWQTFANADSASASNVQGGYAQRLTGGVYETDVSKKYVAPQRQEGVVIEGSRALSSPFSSYLGLAAEVGLLGLALVVGVYIVVLLRSFHIARREIADAVPGDPVPALALATTIGFLTLLQMGFLENWLEVTRITFIVWAIFAVVCKEVDSRSTAAS